MATLSTANRDTKEVRHIVEVRKVPKDQPIGIPDGMTLEQVDKAIHAKMDYEKKVIAVDATIEAPFIREALASMNAVMTAKYGWANLIDTPGMFGPTPPTMMSVEVRAGEYIQVPFGRLTVPNIDGYIETQPVPRGSKRGEPFVLHLQGEIKRRDEDEFNKLAAEINEHVRSNSIYRGTAFSIRVNDEDGNPLPFPEPKFKRLDPLVREQLVLPRQTDRSVQANILTPIRFPDIVKKRNSTLKRGILLAGKFGGGKTMIATVTALEAVENGWTYIEVEHIAELMPVLKIARYYQRVVVFCEDLDRIMRGEDRTVSIDEILNTVDGVDSKGVDMMIVFTTNELEMIQPAMLRPGRLDVVIPIPAPDAEAAERLVRQYGGTMIEEDEEFLRSREALAGKMPAVIREAVDRSKLYAITQFGGDDESLRITDDVLYDAVFEMEDHIRLLTPKVPDERSETVKAADTLALAIRETGIPVIGVAPKPSHGKAHPVIQDAAHVGDDFPGRTPKSQSKFGPTPIVHD